MDSSVQRLRRLPVELVLEILSYLPVQSLHSFQSTSQHWNQVVRQNQSCLYHNVAVLHRFIPSTQSTLSDLSLTQSQRLLGNCDDWKTFCAYLLRVLCLMTTFISGLQRSKATSNREKLGRKRSIHIPRTFFNGRFCASYQSRRNTRIYHHDPP